MFYIRLGMRGKRQIQIQFFQGKERIDFIEESSQRHTTMPPQKKGAKMQLKQAEKARIALEQVLPYLTQSINATDEENNGYQEYQMDSAQYSQRKQNSFSQEEVSFRHSAQSRNNQYIDDSPQLQEQNNKSNEIGFQINQYTPFSYGRDRFLSRGRFQESDTTSLSNSSINLSSQKDQFIQNSRQDQQNLLRQKWLIEQSANNNYLLSNPRQINTNDPSFALLRMNEIPTDEIQFQQNSEGNNEIITSEIEKMSKMLSNQAEGLKLKQQQLMRINSLVTQFSGSLPFKKFKVDDPNQSNSFKQQFNQQLQQFANNSFDQIDDNEFQQEDFQVLNQQRIQRNVLTPTKPNFYSLSQLNQYQQNQINMNELQQMISKQPEKLLNSSSSSSASIKSPGLFPDNLNPLVGFNTLLNMSNYYGKITPMNFNPMFECIKTPPQPPLPPKRQTPPKIYQGNTSPVRDNETSLRKREIQTNNVNSEQPRKLIEIENEIQYRIESIKNEIGPLLACLNSDIMTSITAQKQNQQAQLQQQSEKQTKGEVQMNIHQSRICQNNKEKKNDFPQKRNPNSQRRNTSPIKSKIFDEYGILRNLTPTRIPPQSRVGDWFCFSCKNINFSYRDVCNRCGKPQNKESNQIFTNKNNNNNNINNNNNNNNNNSNSTIFTAQNFTHTNNQNFTNNNNYNNIFNHQSRSNFYSNNNDYYTTTSNNNNTDYYSNQLGQVTDQKTPIRTVDDVKRSFSETQANKENLKDYSNLNNFNQNTFNYSNQELIKVNQPKPIYGIRKPQLSYKQIQDQSEFERNQININSNIEQSNIEENNDNPANAVSHKIVFIDNSSAMPLREQREGQIKYSSLLGHIECQKDGLRKRGIDSRSQIR